MRLAEFFASIAPFLEGRASHPEAARALYGDGGAPGGAHARDAERLALYGRFCRRHRFDALDGTFANTRAALVEAGAGPAGEAAWESLVAGYFRAHPMHHAELNENGSALPAYLAAQAKARGLAPWIAELADLDWWTFRTRVAPDEASAAAPGAGLLRLAPTAELRPYTHDLPGWLDAREAGAAPSSPEPRACVVLFWRDLDLDTRFAEADPLELAVLHAVYAGLPLASAAARAGASAGELDETVEDLVAAGILLGPRAP